MDRIHRIAGSIAIACGVALLLAWLLLRSLADPDGRRLASDAGQLAAFGLVLVAADAYLAGGQSEPS